MSEDIVQLHGTASDYQIVQHGNDVHLKWASVGVASPAENGELIAIFENTSVFDLSEPSFKFIQSVSQQRNGIETESLITHNQ